MATSELKNRTLGSDFNYSRFDLLLAAIPIALVSGLLSSILLPISQITGLVVGAVTAAGIIAYSMYEVVRLESTRPDRPRRSRKPTHIG